MSFKNWMIHLLGGYTKYEYDSVAKRPVAVFKTQPQPIRTLKTKYIIRAYENHFQPSDQWIAGLLAGKLAEEMQKENLILFNTKEYPERECIEVSAMVKVIEPTF